MELRRFLVIVAISTVVILTIVSWFSPSSEDFAVDNPSWNGIKDLESIMLGTPIASLVDLPTLPPSSTLILIPYLEFTLTELEEISSFVAQGGTLILADDFGYGNQVLEYLGLKARFSGDILLDPRVFHGNHRFPRVYHIVPSNITLGIGSLLLNHATCLVDIETSDVLVRSSIFSFLDLDGNELMDEDEPIGPLPVISRHSLGIGKIILISDPSLFINSMLKFEDNLILSQNIVSITTSELFVSQSFLSSSNLRSTKNMLADVRGFFTTLPGMVGLVILMLTITLMPIWHIRREN